MIIPKEDVPRKWFSVWGKDIILIVISFFTGLFFSNSIIPYIANNFIKKDQLLETKIGSLSVDYKHSSIITPLFISPSIARYILIIKNNDSEIPIKDVYISLNFPFIIENTAIRSDQGAEGVNISQGLVSFQITNTRIDKGHTNHINLYVRQIFPQGGVVVDVFCNKKIKSEKVPCTTSAPLRHIGLK